MNQETKKIILRYINKETTPSESLWLKNWIKQSKENEEDYIKFYEAYHANLSSHYHLVDTEKAYQRFQKETTSVRLQKKIHRWYQYAAIILALCTITALFTTFNYSKSNLWDSVCVKKGEKSKFILPDGTKVFLNAGSKLKFNEDFGMQQRFVVLDGEAYFDIAESSRNIPFIIEAAGFIIKDIGTIFKIKAYSEDNDFESFVVEGEISIENSTSLKGAKRIYLTKNQSLKISNPAVATNYQKQSKKKAISSPQIKIAKTPHPDLLPETYDDWVSGNLTFENANFEQITNKLEREFNLKIEIKDESLKNYRYTGKFENIENAFQVLEVIKQNTPISYSSSGETIIIKKLTKN